MIKTPKIDTNKVNMSVGDYNFKSILGTGMSSIVYKAIHNKLDTVAAVKAIKIADFKDNSDAWKLITNQIGILKACNNKNVIKLYNAFQNDQYLFIVTELCPEGSLQEYIKKHGKLRQSQAVDFLKQILNGFKGLHQIGVIHRDIKAANILLNKKTCKIADLGLSKQFTQNSQNSKNITGTYVGTIRCMAPQILNRKKYDNKVDIWSIGTLFYRMLFAQYPYDGRNSFDIQFKIQNYKPSYRGALISKQARDFLQRCLTVNPQDRINWKQIYSHPLLSQKKSSNILQIYDSLDKSVIGQQSGYQFGTISANKLFYQTYDHKQKKQFKYDKVIQIRKSELLVTQVSQKQTNLCQFGKRLKQIEEKKIKFSEYQKLYFNRNKNLMFPQNIIFSQMNNLKSISPPSQLLIFYLCKQTYQDMSMFLNNVKQKKNIFDITDYFKQFSQSFCYQDFIQRTQKCLKQIQTQCQIFSKKVKLVNKFAAQQFVLGNKLQFSLLRNELEGYQQNLVKLIKNQNMKKQMTQIQKQQSYKLLEALCYYKMFFDKDISVQKFQEQIKKMSEELAAQRFQDKFLKGKIIKSLKSLNL